MRKLLILATLTGALASTASIAQEAAAFSGPFVGGQVGWGRRSIDSFNVDQHEDAIEYGAFAGLDLTLGSRFVVGAEGGIGGGGRTLERVFPGNVRTRVDPGLSWSASGRVGILATPRTLIYGRVGYGRDKLRATFSNSTPSLFRMTADGAIYGGGIEYSLSRRFSLRGEYRYADFNGRYHPRQALLGLSVRF